MTVSLGANCTSSASSGCSWSIAIPLIETITSPSLSPALSAGLSGVIAGSVPPAVATSAPLSTEQASAAA